MRAVALLTLTVCLLPMAAHAGTEPYHSQEVIVVIPQPQRVPTRSVSWFTAHPNEMRGVLRWCNENPGVTSTECASARGAETRLYPPAWPSFPVGR